MYRHGPDGHGIALQRIPEVGEHVLADEAVERLDEVEPDLGGDEEEQHGPVEPVQPRDLAAVGLQVRVRRPQPDGRRRRHLLRLVWLWHGNPRTKWWTIASRQLKKSRPGLAGTPTTWQICSCNGRLGEGREQQLVGAAGCNRRDQPKLREERRHGWKWNWTRTTHRGERRCVLMRPAAAEVNGLGVCDEMRRPPPIRSSCPAPQLGWTEQLYRVHTELQTDYTMAVHIMRVSQFFFNIFWWWNWWPTTTRAGRKRGRGFLRWIRRGEGWMLTLEWLLVASG